MSIDQFLLLQPSHVQQGACLFHEQAANKIFEDHLASPETTLFYVLLKLFGCAFCCITSLFYFLYFLRNNSIIYLVFTPL